ncbi:hypothetical protein AY599_18990 [Leptolyngbya valderiana BDU 20041]|nr:hypothetical protein AY599_18990 [Leptolyngbya valderiana BDU 20041]
MAQLEARFDLAAAQSDRFFPERSEDLPSLTAEERASLDKIRHRWMRHRDRGRLREGSKPAGRCTLFD